jgi:hypothetical protein
MFGRGITTGAKLVAAMATSLEEIMRHDGCGDAFRDITLPEMAEAAFSKTSNQSVTGSMTDLVRMARYYPLQDDRALIETSRKLNEAPMSYLGWDSPDRAFRRLTTAPSPDPRSRQGSSGPTP